MMALNISILNPWPPAPQTADPPTPTALPAPPGTRFWLLTLDLTCNLQSGANFFVTDTPHRLATARLQHASQRLSPIGQPADTPDLLTPFTFQKTLQVSPLSPPLRLNLTFCIPTDWPQAQLLLDNQPITTVRPPNPTPPPLNQIVGLWSKMQRQRLPLRHADPFISILAAPNHKIVAIGHTPEGPFTIQFPLTNITTQLARPNPDAPNPTLHCKATTQNQTQTLQLRLTQDAQHLILYVQNQPTNPITYQRLN